MSTRKVGGEARACVGRAGAALALTLAVGGCGSGGPTPPDPVVGRWPIMGTFLEVRVWHADETRARTALDAAHGEVLRVDSLMSTYRPASELSRANRAAGTGRSTPLSPATAEVLAAALGYARLSDGALDVTVGPLVDVWGFYGEEGRLPPRPVLDSARALTGWRRLALSDSGDSVRLPRAGMRLDFGAIAKGYAVDRAVAALRVAGAERAMVDLGGNVGVLGAAPAGGAWRVGLRDPRNPSEALAVVAMEDGAVATSGDYERFFVADGVRYAHIVDPRTGVPVRGTASVSVLAASALASDALSTALYVLGPAEGACLAAAQGVEALWIRDPGPARRGGPPAIEPRHLVVTPGLEERLELRIGRSGGTPEVARCRRP
ncbi:MAG TPA: FAD:protein FMN transferase [Longimicrobiales bacterium]|nr:FAD:protein FMN transferase [Longimicrobiales bacterium]